jgi:hypothetical protein
MARELLTAGTGDRRREARVLDGGVPVARLGFPMNAPSLVHREARQMIGVVSVVLSELQAHFYVGSS